MKVKTISRVEESYTRDCKGDRLQVHRNRDPSLHPFEKVWLHGYPATLVDRVGVRCALAVG